MDCILTTFVVGFYMIYLYHESQVTDDDDEKEEKDEADPFDTQTNEGGAKLSHDDKFRALNDSRVSHGSGKSSLHKSWLR